MPALPNAFLVARITWFTTCLLALAVFTVVATFFLARRAVFGARLTASVTTEKSAVTLGLAWHMDSTTKTTKAVTYNENQSINLTRG